MIDAASIRVTFPAKLPHLQELVIRSQGHLEVEFEDPLATASALTSFYVLGQPLILWAVDVLRLSSVLMRGGLTLDAAADLAKSSRSCIYSRYIDAEQMSVPELISLVEDLVCDCRCGACFECLGL